MVIAMPMMSLCYPMIIQFQAMGKARESLVCSILRKGVLDIPLLFLLDTWLPLYGCMWVQPIVDTISLIVAIGFYRALRRKEDASHKNLRSEHRCGGFYLSLPGVSVFHPVWPWQPPGGTPSRPGRSKGSQTGPSPHR
ncbi:MAG: hypothetical protein ACLR1T_00865 [Evtepia gabavorous]